MNNNRIIIIVIITFCFSFFAYTNIFLYVNGERKNEIRKKIGLHIVTDADSFEWTEKYKIGRWVFRNDTHFFVGKTINLSYECDGYTFKNDLIEAEINKVYFYDKPAVPYHILATYSLKKKGLDNEVKFAISNQQADSIIKYWNNNLLN